MYFVIVKWVTKPDKKTQLYNQLVALKDSTRYEPGCINYNIIVNDSDILITEELYLLEEDASLHIQKPYFVLFKNMVTPMIESFSEHIFEIKIRQKTKPLLDVIFEIESSTSIETIQNISEIFNAVRVIGKINANQILAMPKHVSSIMIDNTKQFIPENDGAYNFNLGLFGDHKTSKPKGFMSKLNWYEKNSSDSPNQSSSEDPNSPLTKERQPIERNFIIGEISYNPDEDNEDDCCSSFFCFNGRF